MKQDFDFCIIGGGFCGIIIAHALKKIGYNCIILEKQKHKLIMSDSRSFVLSYGSGLWLKKIGLWTKDLPCYNLNKVEFSARKCFGNITINAKQYNVPFLGKVINAGEWLNSCYEVASLPEVLYGVDLNDVYDNAGGVVVKFDHNGVRKSLRAKFLIGADGSNSWVREKIGMINQVKLSGYHAVVFSAKKVSLKNAWLRSSESGFLAYIPKTNNDGTLIFTSSDLCLNKSHWQEDLHKLCLKIAGHRLQRVELSNDFNVFPILAQNSKMNQAKIKQAICIGNALHTLPPVAAQGFNLGIRDCAQLVGLVSVFQGRGGFDNLANNYMQLREKDIQQTMDFTIRLMHLNKFTSRFNFLTSLGLLGFDCKLRNFFDNDFYRSMGLSAEMIDLLAD